MPVLLKTRNELISAVNSINDTIGVAAISANIHRPFISHLGHNFLLAQMAEVFPKTILFLYDNTQEKPSSANERISELENIPNYGYLNCDYIYIHQDSFDIDITTPIPSEDLNSENFITHLKSQTQLPLSGETSQRKTLQLYFYYNTNPQYCVRWNEYWKLIAEIGTMKNVVSCKGSKDILNDVSCWGVGTGTGGYLQGIYSSLVDMKNSTKRWHFPSSYLPDGSLSGLSYKSYNKTPDNNHVFSYLKTINVTSLSISDLRSQIEARIPSGTEYVLTTIDAQNPTDQDLANKRVLLILLNSITQYGASAAIEELWLGFEQTDVYQKWPTSEFIPNTVPSNFIQFYNDLVSTNTSIFNTSILDFEDAMIQGLYSRFNTIRS